MEVGKMLPSILARQYQEGLIDYIDTSFPITNPIFKGSIRNMLNTKDAVFHEPYVAVRLPFRVYEGNKSLFEAIHQPFSPYVHQQRAFERLTGEDGRSTLIATGTGSGKTECFLYPILEYCYKHRGEKGIKALIIYPMNALASDQAKRIAELVDGSEELKTAGIRVGMYVGGQEHSSAKMMLPDKVITDHETLLAAPPDILMTNYKMLDYLLVRPKDAELWKNNLPDTLKYIAVDELHTFDGAQGTDLACLLRRLKARLNVLPGQICCIGTSATMGAKDSAKSIREYAADVFGEIFDEDAVITEDRLSSEEFFAGYDVADYKVPSREEAFRVKAWRDAIAIAGGDLNFVENFYKDEWVKVVQAQEVYDKVSYCKASRIGRGVRLDRKVRMQIWDVFDEYQNIMNEKLQRDVETAMYECRKILENKKLTGQYTSIIVDEGQDLSPSAYRLLRSLAGDEHRNDIFIVGDSHQRIYRNKAVLSKCGINVRGRSSYLRINYRTTEEIRKFAFGLLNGVSFDDLDDDYDNGKGCQSLTHGDKPEIKEFATPEEELDYLVSKIHELETAGVEQKNICIVARTHKLLDSYIAGLQRAGIKSFEIKANKTDDRTFEGVRIATMHRVKGLEFDYVFAVAVNKKVLPFGTRADFEDDISLEEFRTGEKCLLYVALTRARKSACVTCYGGLSELIV